MFLIKHVTQQKQTQSISRRGKVLLISCMISLLLIGSFYFLHNKNIESYVYPIARAALKIHVEHEFSQDQMYQTAHLTIYYQTPDKTLVPVMGKLAEQDISKIDQLLSFQLQGRVPVIVYPTRNAMQKSFGWSENQSAVGVYWGDTIGLLSPRLWLKGDELDMATDQTSTVWLHDFSKTYRKNSAFAHEYTHYVLDQQLSDNFPRWFTEGMAQYVEYKVQGYEWIEPDNSLQQKLYSLRELTDQFDDLPNQSLAYRESFMFIRFLIEEKGWGKYLKLRDALALHHLFSNAVQNAYGMSLNELESQWHRYIKKEHVM
ncbi:hypothetical protein LSG31_05575 [Fodinisporobacter ferrooxydans]|uniref:Peptidase MA-like domain-containing protein n=1 Tax=Fodinisporobacter ferrooxydans TaxID=2901836 RepID=A0ABY4CMS4_9BACL|nr:hypothetical protein LSG31_05575 [Alicyclobacillaceae bacterium MYW30-H2]